jgi:hypothetical protein
MRVESETREKKKMKRRNKAEGKKRKSWNTI